MVTRLVFQEKLLSFIGGVDFSEEFIEKIIDGTSAHDKHSDAELIKSYWPALSEFKLETVLPALNEEQHPFYNSMLLLKRALLLDYIKEATQCEVLWKYFRNLNLGSCKKEYLPELAAAEDELLNYLREKRYEDRYKLRHRHLLAVMFLYPEMVKEKEVFLILFEKIYAQKNLHPSSASIQ